MTLIFSVAEGVKSLKEREEELEVLRESEETRQSRFSLRIAPLECNSQQEANAMVLAKWAADEQHFVNLPSGQSEDGDIPRPEGEQNVMAANTNGMLTVGFA